MTETLEPVLKLQNKVKKSDIVSIFNINGKTIEISFSSMSISTKFFFSNNFKFTYQRIAFYYFKFIST